MTACEQAAEVICAAINELPKATKQALGSALLRERHGDTHTFLSLLGSDLTQWQATLDPRNVRAAVAAAVMDGEADTLIDTLGTDPPWWHLREALKHAVTEQPTPEDLDKFYEIKRRYLPWDDADR